MPPRIIPFTALELTIVAEPAYQSNKLEYELIVRDRNSRDLKTMAVDRYLFLENPNLNSKIRMTAGWMYGDNITPPPLKYSSSRKWSSETSLSRVKVIAKRESKSSGIFFDPEAEPVRWDTLKFGPYQNCKVCQNHSMRTFDEVYVCESCVANARESLQREQVKNKTTYTAARDILPYHALGDSNDKVREEYGTKVLLAIHQLLDLPVHVVYNSNATTIGYVMSPSYTSVYQMTTSEARHEAMVDFVKLIREIASRANAYGSLGAKSLLVGLASGKFSIDDFNEEIVKIEKRRES
jgi:hypothetical protein